MRKSRVETLAVVVVSYNTRPLLERCLGAVGGQGHEVIVVDNASWDGSPDLVRKRFPHVRLVELPENRGYGAAANHGIHVSAAPYVLVLNADAWPRDEGSVAALVRYAERDPRLGVAGPRLVGPNGEERASLVGAPSPWWLGAPAVSSFPSRRPRRWLARTTFPVGAALLLRREALNEVGGFDSCFFLFAEEIDLCLRLRKAGWRAGFCREAVFVHVGGAATRQDWPPLYREQLRSHLRLLAKHYGLRRADRARRLLVQALRVRGRLSRQAAVHGYQEAAAWLASVDLNALLAETPRRTGPARREAEGGRTSGSAR
jgi:N-acetylglucosaminyl-diphospho-decaprenol L-rhamnosyltransferase